MVVRRQTRGTAVAAGYHAAMPRISLTATDRLICPACKGELAMTVAERMAPYTTRKGEQRTPTRALQECPHCDNVFAVEKTLDLFNDPPTYAVH